MPAQRSVPMRPTDKNYPKQAMSVALDKMRVFCTGLTPEVGIRELLNCSFGGAAFCDSEHTIDSREALISLVRTVKSKG